MTEWKPIPLSETQMAELFRLREENAEQQARIAQLEEALESIASVNATDMEYQRWAREALASMKGGAA